MLNEKSSWSRSSVFGVAFGLFAGFSVSAVSQEPPAIRVGSMQITGLPDDWTHHHVVFANPGTEQEAISAGRHEQWQKVVNDPRYVVQQLKKNLPAQGPAAVDVEYRRKWISEVYGNRGAERQIRQEFEPRFGFGERIPRRSDLGNTEFSPASDIKRDWSMPLGGPGLAAGHFPDKYSFSNTGASCSDFVVYPTGVAGTASQATIVAFNNIYVGTSGNACAASSPTVYWAFNTPPGGVPGDSATANTSPVSSYDGKQVAFVETYSGTGYLVILKMASEPTSAYNNPSAALTWKSPGTYFGCTAPCYTTISLTNADSNSAPFYVYYGTNADTIYVGDDAAKVHEIAGAFNGSPTIDTLTGWPVTASTATPHALNSPVYDGVSGYIFVTDSGGFLNQFAIATPATLHTSGRLEHNSVNIFDPPILDSGTEYVYTFIGYSGDTNDPSYINRFAANAAIPAGGFGSTTNYGNGTASHTLNPATSIQRDGAFDYEYFLSGGVTGHFYGCVNGHVYQNTITGTTTMTVNTAGFDAPVSALATCSPMTEFAGIKLSTTLTTAVVTTGAVTVTVGSTTGMAVGDYVQIDSEIMLVNTVPTGTTFTVLGGGRGEDATTAATHNTTGVAVKDIEDWLFMSVAASGNGTGCTGACVYNYNVISGSATGTSKAGLSLTGATSGIIVDNQSTSQVGAQQIYFSTLTGHTAVQASQAGLQ